MKTKTKLKRKKNKKNEIKGTRKNPKRKR